MRHLLCLIAFCCAAIPTYATRQQAMEGRSPAAESSYLVGPADELKIVVFDEPTLSGTFRVDADGSIPYSLVGRVPVKGKSAREIEQLLTARLLNGYVRQPRVTVEVAQFRSRKVFIMGEVRTPGQYALEGDVTLLEVLALAGALTDSAGDEISVRRAKEASHTTTAALPEDPQTLEVVRVSLAELQSGRIGKNLVLQDGDTIIVPAAARVFVTEHVRTPGAVVLHGRLTVQQAIALAGGLTERGSNRGIKVRREKKPGEFVEVDVQLTDFVQPNDTIIVRQRRISKRMCGIAGVWTPTPIPAALRLAERLDAALAHRGPNGHGWTLHDDGRLVLIHRRLAIIDRSASAAQPMATDDGRYTIVFNGEIYNHRELRHELEQRGERFATGSDTEVLMRLVAQLGPQALARVRGMFAFALWDCAERALLVGRDRFGIKPLYVSRQRNEIAFTSELRALVDSGVCRREIDPAGVLSYLRWGAIPGPLTWLRDVTALEPGTWIRWRRDFSAEAGRFADVRDLWSDATDAFGGHDRELRERTRAAVTESVRAHMVADVPVGFFLSGGIDSGALVSTAAGDRSVLHTYTVICDEETHNEDAFAGSVAQQFGTTHHTLRVDPSSMLTCWPQILRHMDQPTLDGVNSFFVSRAVAQTGIKAVISGIGGDELFGGYPSFRRVPRGARLRVVPRVLRAAAGRVVTESRASWRVQKLRHAAEHADSTLELYRAVRGWSMPREVLALAGPALCDSSTTERADAVEQAIASPQTGGNVYADVARLETTMYLRQQLLRDVDVMSMAHGLEVRVPFVDHHLIAAVWPDLGSKPELLHRKKLLVESLERPLPDAIVSRPKQGFTLPFECWIDGPLAGFVRDGLNAAASDGWIDRSAPGAVLRDWRARACHWSRPWGLAVLGHFLRNA